MNNLIKKLKLKKIKHCSFASQETNCFEAELWYDGMAIADVSNDGHGGPDMHYWKTARRSGDKEKLEAELQAIADDLGHKYWGMELDSAVGELMNVWLYEKDMQKLMVYKVLYTGKDGRLYSTNNARNAADRKKWANFLAARPDTDKVLNLMPKAEALALFISSQQNDAL